MSDDTELRRSAERVESLLGEIEAMVGPLAWARVQALVTALVELYGAGLGRLLVHGRDCAANRDELDHRLAEDDLVASLLALHDSHPVPIEKRIERALERARDQLDGAHLELESVQGGVASVRATGAASASSMLLSQLVSRAIEHAAPEITSVRIEGAPLPPAPENLVSVDRLLQKARA